MFARRQGFGRWTVSVALVGTLWACGGRVVDNGAFGGDGGTADVAVSQTEEKDAVGVPASPDIGEAPVESVTCAQVCAHIIDQCPGIFDKSDCVAECGLFNAESTTCARAHRAFLACMATVRVICHGKTIYTVGCDEEKNARDFCNP